MKIDKDMGSILGPELKIDGDVSVTGSLLIYGTVNGNIHSDGEVVLGKKSILKGDIIYRKLLIEDGAQFEGKFDIIIDDEPPSLES